ncbi:MAG: type II toxin-antitoxin system HicB family antitoxin [Acidimicrobiia bacterium]
MARTATDRSTTAWTVDVVRSGTWWAISVPDLPGTFSQCRRLEQVESCAREAIALALDVEPDTIDAIDVRCVPPGDVATLVDDVHRSEVAAREATERVGRQRLAAARSLADRGYPLRDIGWLLGISHQRVSQILTDAGRERADAPR